MPLTLFSRLLHTVAVVAAAVTLSFLLLHAAGGDALSGDTMQRGRTAEARALLRERMGLDQPLHTQYVRHVAAVARGDLGHSLVDGRRVSAIVGEAFGHSLLLSGAGLAAAIALGLVVGGAQGWRPHDRLARMLGDGLTALYSVPEFVIAVVLIGGFGYIAGVAPVGGMSDPLVQLTGSRVQRWADVASHLILPTIALALGWGALIARQQRVALRESVRADFVRTARAKGVGEIAVLLRHGVRPSMSAVVATIGVMLPVLAGGAVVVEAVFAWPGMGSLLLRAVSQRDIPVVSGATMLLATVVSVSSLLVDAAVRLLDPRLR